MTTSSMALSIMNPLLIAIRETFAMTMGVSVSRRTLTLHQPGDRLYAITGIISLAGEAAGSVVLSLSSAAAINTVKRMLDLDVDLKASIIKDTVSEFTNMIVGAAKDKLTSHEVDLGLPSIVTGERIALSFPSRSQPMRIEFDSEIGKFMVVFGVVYSP